MIVGGMRNSNEDGFGLLVNDFDGTMFSVFDSRWVTLRECTVEAVWSVRRNEILKLTKKFIGSCGPRRKSTLVNPFGINFSVAGTAVLSAGPKFCINIGLSRLDVLSAVQKDAAGVKGDVERTNFVEKFMKRMSTLAHDLSLKVDSRNIEEVRLIKKDLSEKQAVLIETDKSGCFAILPRLEFPRKADETLSAHFQWFDGD